MQTPMFVLAFVFFSSFFAPKIHAAPKETPLTCTAEDYTNWQQAIQFSNSDQMLSLATTTNCLQSRSWPSLLSFAATNSTFETYVSLVDLGADILTWRRESNRDECYYQALHTIQYFRLKDSLKFVQFLVERGADVQSRPLDGISGTPSFGCWYSELPLAKSVMEGDEKTFHYLADRNAIMLGRELTQNKTDNFEIAKRLIQMGANVNFKDIFTRHQTPLYSARSLEIFKLLLAHGAQLNVQDRDGKTPIGTYMHTEMDLIHAAIDAGADLTLRETDDASTPVIKWARMYYWGMAPAYHYALAHSRKIDIDQADSEGKTPLMILSTVGWDRKRALKATIEKGANVNARDANGKSVLDYWIEDPDPETIQLLREAGAVK